MDPSSYLYHPFYCEENIWHLCQQPEFAESQVLIIASMGTYFAIFGQRLAESAGQAVFWDYHVVLLHEQKIYDFDTALGFGIPVADYLRQSFVGCEHWPREYVPWFRLLSADEYVCCLRSDRRHMQQGGQWLQAPPPWPAINEFGSNLMELVDMCRVEWGRVVELQQLVVEGSLQLR